MPNDRQDTIQPAAVSDATGSLTPLGELQLVDAHRNGDPEAISVLLRGYQRRVYAVCYRMVRNEDDARDLAQDAMVKILQGLDSYDGRSKLSTWVIRVTMNCCLSHLRKQRLRRHGSIEREGPDLVSGEIAGPRSGGGELSPETRVEQTEMRDVLTRALHGLDPDTRAVLVLRDMQDLEYHRIAGVLDVPVGTVKSRLFRARLALRNAMEVELARSVVDGEPISETG
jgi:RNA polymerase sigma-70 factor (ECF subfamily)